MFDNIRSFYPTPRDLARRMIGKIKGHPAKILEPSAGKGDLIDVLKESKYDRYTPADISAIEVNEELQYILRGKGIKVIDCDFLTFSGPDQFDLIIANPPFDEGDKHLLKAIDIMYRGQIIFLLNAETLRNPYTNIRKDLLQRLEKLNAEIEFLTLAFTDAERPTDVECALIYINIERHIEDDLFAGCTDKAESIEGPSENDREHEVSTGRTIEELVAEYNQVIRLGTETIWAYFRNYPKIGRYLFLNDERNFIPDAHLTGLLQLQLNRLLDAVRTDFWRKTLDLKEVQSRLTKKKQAEFEDGLKKHCYMDFTEHNIRQFVLNLMGGFEQTLTDAVVDLFDKFTIKHCFGERGEWEENIHLYNGWKTNRAYYVNRKIIFPLGNSYEAFWDNILVSWRLGYNVKAELRDVDVVMNYFDGGGSYVSTADAIETAFGDRRNNRYSAQTKKIKSTYFTIDVFKKGTIHLTFNSEDILRRFNVAACKGKGWLPGNYGSTTYDDMNPEEKAVVDSFEGQLSYSKNLNRPLFATTPLLRIAA